MDLEGQINEWKKKYENSEKNLATLKKLAHKGKSSVLVYFNSFYMWWYFYITWYFLCVRLK